MHSSVRSDKVRRGASTLLTAGVLIAAAVATSHAAPNITGYVDTTYGYNLDRPASRKTALRSMDQKTDVFLLNSAQVAIDGSVPNAERGDVGYRVELDYGTDAAVYKAAGTGIDAGLPGAPSNNAVNFEVQEAYLTYKCAKTGIQTKFGKFVTFEGIEVIESKDNFTISRGHLFGLAEAFTHVGGLVGYALPKYVDFWVGAVNGWDIQTDNNSGKTFLAKVGFNFGEMAFGSISMSRGSEKANNTNDALTSIDTTWFFKPVKPLTVALQLNGGENENTSIADRNSDGTADGGAGHWYGAGIQPKVDIGNFFIGGRYEWFSDLDGTRTGTTQVLQNVTLSPGINLTDNLMFRVEYRHDWSSRMVFEDADGRFRLADTNTIGTEFIYKFN